MQKDLSLGAFLQTFIYLMCSRCEAGAFDPDVKPQEILPGSGSHAHNGELAALLPATAPTIERIGSAYVNYLNKNTPKSLARGYAAPARLERLKEIIQDKEFLALAQIEQYHNSTWLRHGLEHVDFAPEAYQPTAIFPPPDSRFAVGSMVQPHNQDHNYYAIDVDAVPFIGCTDHWVDDNCGQPWAYVAGYLPLEIHLKHRGEIYNTPDRDHYYAKGSVPAQHWVFIWRKIPQRAVKRKQQEDALYKYLLPSKLYAIELDTYQYYTRLVHKLKIHQRLAPIAKSPPAA